MKKFAVLDASNLVANIIIAGSKDIAEQVTGSNCAEINYDQTVNINDSYNGTTFVPAETPEVEPEA